MDVIKKPYHLFCMRNERNVVYGVRGNGTVNMPVLVICTGLWSLSETRGRHMLNVLCQYNL